MRLKLQKRIPEKIAQVMEGDEDLPTFIIYDRLMDALAYTRKGRTKAWRNTPTKQQVGAILSSGLYPQFVRVSEKGQYPTYWRYLAHLDVREE